MLRPSRSSRFTWFVAALFQLLVPTVWSVADARADAMSVRAATVHVEAPGSTACPRVHGADCAVCRVLGAARAPNARVSFELLVVAVIDQPPTTLASPWPAARAPGDPPQRAPPV
jgi:hypothetical protein